MLRLRFHRKALAEYRRLDPSIQSVFRKKLGKLLDGTERPSPRNALHGFPPGFFKIKLRRPGWRLVYHYDGADLVVLVLAVGKRERGIVYDAALTRLGRK